MPYIQKEFDPHLVSRLGKVSSLFQEDEFILKKLTEKERPKVVQSREGQIFLDLNVLSTLPVGLARRLVREFIAEIKGDLRKISFEDIESVLGLGVGKEYSLIIEIFNDMRRKRNTDLYGGGIYISEKDANEYLELSKSVLDAIRDYIK